MGYFLDGQPAIVANLDELGVVADNRNDSRGGLALPSPFLEKTESRHDEI
jgi:hypothetical protein